jgi:hypothetical protein
MSDNFKKILIASVAIIAALALSFIAGQRDAQKRLILPQKEREDTLVLYETKLVEKPVFIEKKVVEKVPVPVPVSDTMMVHDTIYVYMDREQVHWQDSLSDVYASGYDVQVDSVRHNIQTQVITKERDVIVKVKPKWSIGVHAGYGAFANNGQISASPYIGVGVTYNLFSW